jgi:hypothetical protein
MPEHYDQPTPTGPEGPQGPPTAEGGGESPAEAVTMLLDALQNLHQGIARQAPPEAVQALEAAISAYQQFLEIIGIGGAPQGGPPPGGPEPAPQGPGGR